MMRKKITAIPSHRLTKNNSCRVNSRVRSFKQWQFEKFTYFFFLFHQQRTDLE